MTDATFADAPRVWMNMSTSVNWTRPPVGIVRVELELFKALREKLGERLIPCVFEDGKFHRYAGRIGTDKRQAEDEPRRFIWPDPSYDFPNASFLDPAHFPAVERRPRLPNAPAAGSKDEIGFGDVVISVGLDWDWENVGLDKALRRLKVHQNVKVISCCYDLIPVLFPQYCVGDVAAKFRGYFTNLTWASSGMLCISQRSEDDYRALAAEMGLPEIATKVMRLGNKLPEADGEVSAEVERICQEPFILFVSTIERRKNHEVLYKALRILAEEDRLPPDLKLVFVGMPGWGVADLLKDFELDPLVSDRIVLLGHTNDAELHLLYQACSFLVFPSFYEGWGLPVAEALAFGKFVIASNRGSIPEVGGDLVDYVDPYSATDWAEAIGRYWQDPAAVARRAQRIAREYHPIHWHETARAVLELIEAIEEPRRQFEIEPGYEMSTVAGTHFGPRILSTGEGGVLCHGPYWPLPTGTNIIEVEFERLGDAPVQIDFRFLAGRGTVRLGTARRQLTKARQTVRLEVSLTKPVEDFEVVIHCPKGAQIAIDRMTIDPGRSAAADSHAKRGRSTYRRIARR